MRPRRARKQHLARTSAFLVALMSRQVEYQRVPEKQKLHSTQK